MSVREAVSARGLAVRARHRRNPYRYLLDDARLADLLLDLGLRRAESIWRNHNDPDAARGPYPRDSMGFVLLDPTAQPWETHEEAVLAAITVGAEGHAYLANAAAKAAGHRRLGRNYGEAVLVDPHLCGTDAFRYGHSADVRGVIAGASSQSPDQDLVEAGLLAADFVDAITEHHRAWEATTGKGRWLNATDTPGPEAAAMVAFFDGN
ncbi:hypothetical protein V5P93_006147 [Actinokineospora auranticolor]|uniref:Uncharacterized protein n=1 Tax=Actinokineospora auranticolor TaxID=155976 RepID=A0A2S6GG81_9PSEU|nr:hypothetical protein [Actinokineospora auranticolor]PPK64238.1 hypothetical protein CLV40_121102 [Actinokineospora auranticolor]